MDENIKNALRDRKTICFTGPRPRSIHGYRKAKYHAIVDRVEALCRELAASGVTDFISGGAQGFDQLAFWAVDRLRRTGVDVGNEVYVPFPGQPQKWRADGLFGRGEYSLILRRATRVTVVSGDPEPGAFRDVVRKLNKRNHAMVNASDAVVALVVLDEDETLGTWLREGRGGTAECVRYARSQGVPVVAIEYRPGAADEFSMELVEP